MALRWRGHQYLLSALFILVEIFSALESVSQEMSNRWIRVERGSWIFGILGGVIAILGAAIGWLFPVSSPGDKPALVASVEQPAHVDEHSVAQAMRTAATSFRALAADRENRPFSVAWQSAERDFQMGNQLYEMKSYVKAAVYFDKAGRAFNDIYSSAETVAMESSPRTEIVAASASELGQGRMGRQSDRVAHLEAYIKKIDAEIRQKEKEIVRASPLEAGALNNSIMNSLEEEIRVLRSVRTEAQRKIIDAIGN